MMECVMNVSIKNITDSISLCEISNFSCPFRFLGQHVQSDLFWEYVI